MNYLKYFSDLLAQHAKNEIFRDGPVSLAQKNRIRKANGLPVMKYEIIFHLAQSEIEKLDQIKIREYQSKFKPAFENANSQYNFNFEADSVMFQLQTEDPEKTILQIIDLFGSILLPGSLLETHDLHIGGKLKTEPGLFVIEPSFEMRRIVAGPQTPQIIFSPELRGIFPCH